MKTLTISIILMVIFTVLQASAGDLPASILDSRPGGAPSLSIPSYAKINAALQRKGTARIIVRLAAPPNMPSGFALEGTMKSAESVANQRAGIAQIQGRVASKLSKSHGGAAKRFEFIPFMAMEVDPAEFNALAASGDIDLIEEDIPVPPTLIQSVPLIGGIGGAFNGYSGNGQTVAILDTGVDKTHPFLVDKVVSEACYSTTDESDESIAVCAPGSTLPGQGVNCSSAITDCDHGTHIAGIVAGNGGTFNGTAFSGVARDAKLISVQVFSQFPATSSYCNGTPCVLSYTSDQILGLERVYNLRNTYNIASVNMSLGTGSYTENCDAGYTAEKAAIDNLRSVGIATVIASGNDGYTDAISAPACISTAISVGATDKSDVVASYSNNASMLSLLAPGILVYSSTPVGAYGYKSGTSMAAPHVSGAWAVLKSTSPTATVTEVLSSLASTGKNIVDVRNSIIKPRIQLAAAVIALSTGPINGVCGISNNRAFPVTPTSDYCLVGTASIVSGNGPWAWTCSGLNSGTTANCLAFSTSQQVTLVSQNFDGVSTPALPTGWTSNGETTGSWKTHVGTLFPFPYPPHVSAAHTLSNLVYFNSFDVVPSTAALLSSPAFSLAGKTGGKVSFWMYHDSQFGSADLIKVYINTASNLIGARLLDTVYRNNGSDGWYQYTFDIPDTFAGTQNYLLINGISDYGNNIHLDDISVYAFTPAYLLTFSFAGTGYGSVNSSLPGINCYGTTGSVCASSYFIGGKNFTLSAVPDSSSSHKSTFTGWTTACSGTGACNIIMNGPVNVTGTFNRDMLVKISASGVSYGTILEAYDSPTSSGQTIQVRDNSNLTPFSDILTINKRITLRGGFASGFGEPNTGYTTTNGKLTVASGGVLKVQRIKIR